MRLKAEFSGQITMNALRKVCEDTWEYHYMELLFFSLDFTLEKCYSQVDAGLCSDDSSFDRGS